MLINNIKIIFIASFFFLCTYSFAQKYTDTEIKSAYIFQFAQNIEWPNEDNMEIFKIGVYGMDTSISHSLQTVAKSQKIRKKSIEVIQYNDITEIYDNKPQLLFITEEKNTDIKGLYYQLFGENILFVSNGYKNQIYVMLNLIYLSKTQISFEVNKKTIEEQGLSLLPDLLLLGGTELDVRMLYKLKEEELALEQEKVSLQQEKIKEQQNHINQQLELISTQNSDINKQNTEIQIQKKQIGKQEKNLFGLLNEITLQSVNIREKEKVLIKQELEAGKQNSLIIRQKEDLSKGQAILKSQHQEIQDGLEKIKTQTSTLNNLEEKLTVKNTGLLLMGIIIILVIILALYIYRSSKVKQKINKKLIKLNDKLQISQEELKQTNEELSSTNEELSSTNELLYKQKEEIESTLEQLKEAQLQLIQSEKMASVGILTAGIAHEINNPLNFIQGGVFGIEKYLEKNLKDHITNISPLMDGIKLGVKRVGDIVKSLNHFNRKSDTNTEKCDIHLIIDNCLLMLQNKLKHKVEIEKNYTKSEFTVIGNEGKFHQMVLNIISNAEQSIDENGTISISTDLVKNKITLQIKDTGCGISTEDLSKITDPFFTTKDPGKGTGLGLSIVYNIIKEHHGNLEYNSELGKGTTVTIILPINHE